MRKVIAFRPLINMSRPVAIQTLSAALRIPEESESSPRSTAPSLTYSSSSSDEPDELPKTRRASTKLISQNAADVRRLIGDSGTSLIERCCGGGCCMAVTKQDGLDFERVPVPDNDAYRALKLKISLIPITMSGMPDLPPKTITMAPYKKEKPLPSPTDSAILIAESHTATKETDSNDLPRSIIQPGTETEGNSPPISISTTEEDQKCQHWTKTQPPAVVKPVDEAIDFTPHTEEETIQETEIDTKIHPPKFVKPHYPYDVFSAKIFSARELTRPGAEKRTFHFDLDVTDYPEEGGVDFKVGGAVGVMAPNDESVVDELMDTLLIPRFLRDRPVLLKTQTGRWPTIWDADEPRELVTTRRDLLTWCTDIQSSRPTKSLLRLLAEYASDFNEKKILNYLCSAEGQGAFCDLRTDTHITLSQLLHAFPSSKPPLDHLLTQLESISARFYSLSNDPHENCIPAAGCTRLIEIAVTVHEANDWRGGQRTGIGSGFFERQAKKFIEAEKNGEEVDLRIPIFKGLMANPLARDFVSDGPMLLIGAGVGVAPFRGFVQRRLKNANCANKVWVLQGVRDSLLDELYSGEWGVHESEVKKVVQSRRSDGKQKGKYVQDEVLHQADLVWYVINALEGRVFVCGSSKGMGEGVEAALHQVAMKMGNLSYEEAKEFWKIKEESGQYTAETW
jgi:sulfite reductase alpha subunit-like flavoprotein